MSNYSRSQIAFKENPYGTGKHRKVSSLRRILPIAGLIFEYVTRVLGSELSDATEGADMRMKFKRVRDSRLKLERDIP
jgi:hypothetical protein